PHDAGEEPAVVSAGPGAVGGPGLPVRALFAVVGTDEPDVGVVPVLDAHGVSGAGGDVPGGSAGRRPRDIFDRRAVSRVEKARRTTFGQRLALHPRVHGVE